MARTRTGKATILLALGFLLASGSVLGGFGAPAQAAALPPAMVATSTSLPNLLGPNRTTASSGDSVRHRHQRAGTSGHGTAGRPVSTSVDADPAIEEGTTADDLTAGGHSAWWWGAWLLLAVPAGSALAWWVNRPRATLQPSSGPLYS